MGICPIRRGGTVPQEGHIFVFSRIDFFHLFSFFEGKIWMFYDKIGIRTQFLWIYSNLKKKSVKNGDNFAFFSNFSKMCFLVLNISKLKCIQSSTSKSMEKKQKRNKSDTWGIFFSWLCSVICLKLGQYFGKMARSRSFPGLFEFYRSKYSKQTPLIISSYGETQANSYFTLNRHPKLTPQNNRKSSIHWLKLQSASDHALKSSKQP